LRRWLEPKPPETVPLSTIVDKWAEGRRYLGLEILAKSRLNLITNPEQETPTMPALAS